MGNFIWFNLRGYLILLMALRLIVLVISKGNSLKPKYIYENTFHRESLLCLIFPLCKYQNILKSIKNSIINPHGLITQTSLSDIL